MVPTPPKPAVALEVRHARVPGRLRLHVPGLHRRARLASQLESALPGRAGIRSASASARTGNLLLLFDAAQDRAAVLRALQAVLEGAALLECADPPEVPARERPRRLAGAPVREAAVVLRRLLGRSRADSQPRERLVAATPDADTPAWHLMEAEACVKQLETSETDGLDEDEARARLERIGPNALERAETRSRLALFLEQLESLPVAMLAVSGAVALATGGFADAIVIGAVVWLNAAIGYATEAESEKTLRALTAAPTADARLLRAGARRMVSGEDVVPGDLLVLGPGSPVVADARIVHARQLAVDESLLTGESLSVEKTTDRIERADTPLRDRNNMVYRGTHVTAGSGVAVVVATGPATETGRIQHLVAKARPPETPAQAQLRQLGNQLVLTGGVLCAGIFGAGMLRGYGLVRMLRSSISLAVAALPEGLPTVATTTLALGVRDLRRRRVLVRHLDAIETLGCVRFVCLDKTGTITRNRMSVVSVAVDDRCFALAELPRQATRDGSTLRALVEACALCSEARIVETEGGPRLEGSPTERALLDLALRAGLDVATLRRAHPLQRLDLRADRRNYMASIHRTPDGRRRVALKGNPVEVLALCTSVQRAGGARPLDDEERSRIDSLNGRMAGDGLRVLGVACAALDAGSDEWSGESNGALTWLGLVGMADPPREEIPQLLEAFHAAGIETAMITGDQSATAYAIAREIGLSGDGELHILDATEFEKVPREVMAALAERVQVFSRVSPAHKLEIVQALQRAGHVVVMTGDGINDGPALKAADVGIAMGAGGSELARAVSDMVLERDELPALLDAILRGRTIHSNTRKAVHFLLSSNLSEILVMFGGIASGIGEPLGPLQLLWLNLMTDVLPGLGLAVEPPDPAAMRRPARDPHEPLLRRADFARVSIEGALLAGGTLGAWLAALRRDGQGPRAGSVAFMTLTVGQLLHAIGCRSETHSLFDGRLRPANRPLALAVGGSLALQLATPYVPGLRGLLGLAPLGLRDLALVAAGAGFPLLAHEALKKLGFWARDERPVDGEGVP
jgi:Ca2+-transporting ATPase